MRLPQPISAADIQDAVIPLLQACPLIARASLPEDPANAPLFTGQVQDDDPGAPDVLPGAANAASIALHLLGEGERPGTGGPAGVGTRVYTSHFALIVYVGQGGRRDRLAKRKLAVLTRNCVDALMQDAVRVDPAGPGGQRWFSNGFKDDGPATVYQKSEAFRRSVTFINFYSRPRTMVAT